MSPLPPDHRTFEQALRKMELAKPQLVAGYHNFKAALQSLCPVDPGMEYSLLKLSYAAEYVYLDASRLFPLLLQRGELTLFADLLYDLAALGYQYALTMLEAYPRLRFALTLIAGDVRALAVAAAVLPRNGVEVLAICLRYSDMLQCRFMLQQMALIARYSPGTMLDCAGLIYRKLSGLPPALLQRWILRGTDLITSNRVDEGVRFLLQHSGESRQLLGLNHVVLEEFRTILKIYCASLAGRELNIAGLEISAFEFKSPYTDGATIFLPPEMAFFPTPSLNERVYTVLAALQAASLRLGTFTLDTARLEFRQELSRRYGTMLPEIVANVRRQYGKLARTIRQRADGELEVVFGEDRRLLVLNTEHEKFFYSFPTPDFARQLFTLVENCRIECILGGIYSGLKEDFIMVNSFLWEKRPLPVLPPAADRPGRFRAALEILIQLTLTKSWKGEITELDFYNLIQSLKAALEPVYAAEATVQTSSLVMFNLYNIFFDHFPVVPFCAQYDIRENFAGLQKPELYSEVVLDASPELLKAAKEEFISEAAAEEEQQEVDLTSFSNDERQLEQLRREVAAGKVRVFKYPEFDYLKNSYLKEHCTLIEQILPTAGTEVYDEALRTYRQEYKKIRKRFMMMKPEGMELSRRWYSGSEIHITDAVDYCISLLRGESPDEKIYYRKILNRRDIVVAILVDASSSTDTMVGRQSIIATEKTALALLASVLDVIDDPFGVFSFFSLGRHQVFVNVVKDYNEAWDRTAQGRIASLKAYAGNRDGCAIRHITARLLEQPQTTRLLLLSDGIPADLDYGSKNSSETSLYAIEDTRRAIIDSRKQGIIPYCLTIDRFARRYIAHLYGDYHYAVLSQVARLPEKLAQLYLRLTR